MRNIKIFLIIIFSANSMAVVTVGSSPGFGTCTYLTIQEAIDSGENEIRILNNQTFFENINLSGSIILKGGYGNCLFAQINLSNNTLSVINGGSSSFGLPAVQINSSFEAQQSIKFYKLNIKGAKRSTLFTGGGQGIKIASASVFLELFDSAIFDNNAFNGAGIYIDNPLNADVILNNTTISSNVAISKGGGIYCANNNTNIVVQNGSAIYSNSALNGGGIYAKSCNVTISSGVDINENVEKRGIMNNHATNNGGGIYADFGADISLYGNRYGFAGILGDASDPVTLANNEADNDGGGIYADRNSRIIVEDGLISYNSANNGGAFYLDSFSELDIRQAPYNSCWSDENKCSIMSDNQAGLTAGGIFVMASSLVNVTGSYIYANRADIATFLYLKNTDSWAKLKYNFIYENGNNGLGGFNDEYVIKAFDNTELEIYHNTITDNNIENNSAIFNITFDAKLFLYNSIIHNQSETILHKNSSAIIQAECDVVNELTSISGVGLVESMAGFVDKNINNFHLSGTSIAIDLCQVINETDLDKDIDKDISPWDDYTVFDVLGLSDAGADETYINDIIFNNGFE